MKTGYALLFCLAIATPALAADSASAPVARPDASPPSVEIIGFVSSMQGAGVCMDGATHLIHSALGDFRLKAANPQAARDLAKVANGKERATVIGHRVDGPECVSFVVDRVNRMAHE